MHATAGNIGVRLDDGFLITPTGVCLGTLDPARLDAQGVQTGGDAASKTLALHRCIYGADAAAACALHTHSTHLVALTLQGVWSADDTVPPITPHFVMKVGHVPLIAYHRPGDPQVGVQVGVQVAAQMARHAERGTPLRGDAGPPGPQRVAPQPTRRLGGAGRAG